MKRNTTVLAGFTAIVLSLAATACSSDDPSAETPRTDAQTETTTTDSASPGTSAPAGGVTVGITNSRYETTEILVSVGETVTVTNNDPFAHTVTSKDGSAVEFDSGRFGQGETFEVSFDEAGTYEFFCQVHPTMRAMIVAN